MSSGLYYAVSGFRCQEKQLEMISNNLANAGTAGFKEDKPSFKGIYPAINVVAPMETPEDQRRLMLLTKMNMSYPALSLVETDHSPGQIKHTGNQLDMALEGRGFFVVDTPRGELYTRVGSFALNEKKELVTLEGYPVKKKTKDNAPPEDERIKIEGTEVAVDREGRITVDGNPGDTLRVVDFEDYSGLHKVGDNLFEHTGGKENELKAEGCAVNQRHTESSNVSIVPEMIKLITVSRICESYQKAIQTLDELDARATRDVGAVA